jgi:transcriptional regulator with XRE-family HTH domain
VSTTEAGRSIPQFTLADRLRKARTDRNVTSREMAKVLNRSVSSIHGYENGSIPVRVDVVNAYALRLTVPVSWLLTGRDPGPIPPGTSATRWYLTAPATLRAA